MLLVIFSYVLVRHANTRPGYDPYGWLIWGYQTLHLSLDLGGAPSWKPLPYLFTVPMSLFGTHALTLWMTFATAVSLSGSIFAGRIAYRLTLPSDRDEIDQFTRWAAIAAGVFAGLAVLGINQWLHLFLSAQSDTIIAALCLGAIDMHLSGHPRWAYALLVLAALGRQNGFLQQYDINLNKIIFSSTALQNLNKGNNSYNLFIDNDGDIWLWALNNGVFLFQPQYNSVKQFNENSFPSRLNTNLVSQIVQDNNGLIWVATDHGGVNLINKKDNFSISYLLNDPKDPRSLSQNSITAMYKDDNGIIWLGTYKQGVNYLNSNIVLFPLYRHQESNVKSLPYDDVNRFVEDKSGNIWIGTNGGGLIFFDRKQNTFKQYLHDPNNKNSLSNNVIVSLCIDHEGILWIGTYFGGLNSFDGKKFTHYRHSDNDSSSLANDNVWEIFEDREQNLWIGTLGGGLDHFRQKDKPV